MSRSPKAIVLSGLLYPLGWLPDPLERPPRQYAGDGRFDDPLGEFRVLYAAEQRFACLVETLYRFRRPPHSFIQNLTQGRNVAGG